MSDPEITLNKIEVSILKNLDLANPVGFKDLIKKTSLGQDQIRRGVEWLKYKELINIKEIVNSFYKLDSNGIISVSKGIPERRLINSILNGKKNASEVLRDKTIDSSEINIAIAKAKSNGWIILETNGELKIITNGEPIRSDEEVLLNRIKGSKVSENDLSTTDLTTLKKLSKRPKFIKEIEEKILLYTITQKGLTILKESQTIPKEPRLTVDLLSTGNWKNVSFSKLDVQAPVPLSYPGKRHPLTELIDEIRCAFLGLGFTEIEGDLVQSSFWNFDALFTPQDHAAREMQDTFYVQNYVETENPDPIIIKNVSNSHKLGWNYDWKIEDSQRSVLRTHTTPVTLKYLSESRPEEAKIFTIGRVFRNEKVSYKHLVEFNQIEGIITGKDVTLRDLMGIQKEFYSKLGIKKIKFWPTFFPYTEPSLQSMIFNENLEKWVELFGMGIFRPEVTRPLNIPNPVLAWGGGIERIAMLRYGLNDVRDLYTNNLSWLRNSTRCL